MKILIHLSLLPLLLIVIVQCSYSQMKPVFNWERSIDTGWSTSILTITPSGDILASSNANYTNHLIRLNSQGKTLWTLPYGGWVYGDTIAIDTRYVDEYQGKTRMLGLRVWDVFGGSGWLLGWEINSEGEPAQWCCERKIAQPTYGMPRGILPSDDGGMYLSGTVRSGIQEDRDKVYFTKTDTLGKAVAKVYNDIKVDTGDADVMVNSFIRMPDGGFVIAGDIHYFKTGGAQDVFILRIDSVGNKLWSKNYGSTYAETLARVVVVKDGGFLLTCRSRYMGDELSYGIYCIKTDSSGIIQWEKSYFEPNFASVAPLSIIQSNDNNFVIVGKARGGIISDSGDCFILQIDSNGKKLLSHRFGSTGDDFLQSIAERPNGLLNIGGRLDGKMYVAEVSIPTIILGSPDESKSTLSLSVSQQQTGETLIQYSAPVIAPLSLTIFSAVGEQIQHLTSNSEGKAGVSTHVIPTGRLATGVYYIRLTDGISSVTKSFAIIR